MRLVLDTNVLVSALLTPHGHPAQLLHLILSGKVTLILSAQIYAEYQLVLARPKFMFNQERVQELLDFMANEAEFVFPSPLKILLPDPKDLVFLEVAVAANVYIIVTGNLKHFPKKVTKELSITIFSPTQFLDSFSFKQE